MDHPTIVARLEPVFADVFGRPIAITRELDATAVEDWDSLNHISLVAAVEGEFGIELTPEDLETMLNVGDLIDLIERKQA